VEISVIESEIWLGLKSDTINPTAAVKRLTELRDTGTTLSYRSMELLALEKENSRLSYIDENKDQPLVQNTLITCMDVLKKDSDDNDAISLLVIGTEAGQLYILPQDPQNNNVLCRLQLPATPSLLAVSGTFDVEWRITVLCRDGRMYSVKNGDVRGSAVLVGMSVDLGSQAVSLAKQDKQLWIALMDRSISFYSARGKRLKTMIMQEDVAELSILSLRRAKVSYLLLVALVSGEIIMCKETIPLHSFKVDSPVVAVVSGLYGREENSIAIVHGHSGSLTIKMWRRTVDVDGAIGNGQLGPPPEQDMPLPVPKKTKLFVEQTQREREHAGEIHRAFQRDLCKLRLTTARAYVQTLTDGLMTATGGGVGSGSAQDIRISVQVQGLGPKFLLRVSLQNSGNHTFSALRVVFSFDTKAYTMGFDEKSQQSLYVSVLLPGPRAILETQILSIDPMGRGGQILCLVYRDNAQSNNLGASTTTGGKDKSDAVAPLVSAIPLLSAAVKMPQAEPLLS
jgi:Bardet-Biedl syndrome 1 protein